MGLSYSKFKRGQIWMVKDDNNCTRRMEDVNNHITEKSRPWVIISNDIANDNAPILNCAPISSKTNKLPPHVFITMEKGVCSIQCEQITTLNISCFKDAEYIGTLSDKNMQRVEVALANQLGLSIQMPSLDTLQAFIEKLAIAKAEELKQTNNKITDDYVLSLAEKLESIFSISNSDNQIKSVDDSYDNTLEPKQVKKTIIRSKNWTKEMKAQFLEDCEKLSLKDIRDKYKLSEKSVYNYKYRFKNEITKDGGLNNV